MTTCSLLRFMLSMIFLSLLYGAYRGPIKNIQRLRHSNAADDCLHVYQPLYLLSQPLKVQRAVAIALDHNWELKSQELQLAIQEELATSSIRISGGGT